MSIRISSLNHCAFVLGPWLQELSEDQEGPSSCSPVFSGGKCGRRRDWKGYLGAWSPAGLFKVNHVVSLEEWASLKKLGDSLMTRSNKVSELIGALEGEIGKKPDSAEAKRAEKSGPNHHINLSRWWALRSVKALEECLAAISAQYEAVEATKVDVSALKTATAVDDATKKSGAH